MTERSQSTDLATGSTKLEIMAPFYKRLATLFQASIPIAQAIDSQRHSGDDRLDEVVTYLHMDIVQGHTLSGAMSKHPRAFSSLAVGLVKAGEESGYLDRVVSKLADMTEQALRMKRSIISSLTYPAVLCLTILGLAGLFASFICSQDQALFGASSGELPWPTRVVVTFAEIITNPFLVCPVVLGLVGAILLGRRELRVNSEFRLRFHTLLLHLPVVGKIIKDITSTRIIYVLGLCLDVGIGILQAFSLAERICWNDSISLQLRQIQEDIGEGSGVAESMARQELFPRIVLYMTEVGEHTGELADLWARVSESLETDINDSLTAISQLIEPMLLIASGAVAAFVALAALAPLLELLQTL